MGIWNLDFYTFFIDNFQEHTELLSIFPELYVVRRDKFSEHKKTKVSIRIINYWLNCL